MSNRALPHNKRSRASLVVLSIFFLQTVCCKDVQDKVIIATPEAHSCARVHPETGSPVAPSLLILHYTGVTLAKTLHIFLGYAAMPVSSHYTISQEGIIFQHVAEERAARHAGASYWDFQHTLNIHAIGVEHVNYGFKQHESMSPGKCIPGSDKEWYFFEPEQIVASRDLCKEIIERYGISPRHVVGHSDVAPGRKLDPGPLFPWHELAQHGIGAWPDFNKSWLLPCLQKAQHDATCHTWLLRHLALWGYKSADQTTTEQDIIQAFQMHFRQGDIAGYADEESTLIMNALICTYLITADGCCPCSDYGIYQSEGEHEEG